MTKFNFLKSNRVQFSNYYHFSIPAKILALFLSKSAKISYLLIWRWNFKFLESQSGKMLDQSFLWKNKVKVLVWCERDPFSIKRGLCSTVLFFFIFRVFNNRIVFGWDGFSASPCDLNNSLITKYQKIHSARSFLRYLDNREVCKMVIVMLVGWPPPE